MKRTIAIALSAAALGGAAQQGGAEPYTLENHEGYTIVRQADGPALGYSPESGVALIVEDGKVFKNLSRSGELLPYEDWRLSAAQRAADLAERLSMEQIAGLMLYSNHQAVPATSYDVSTYNGEPYREGVTPPWELTDHQKKFLSEDNLRHVLVTIIRDPETAARWNNRLQAFVEGIGFGIPANNSSDPRHSARADAEFNAGGGGAISMWPSPIGLGATFDPEVVKDHGRVASQEYRALGFATALSPQVDLGTEPRWYRFYGTFGCDPALSADMARAYCDGFQTSEGDAHIAGGWGYNSVNAMVKHWPGGAPCESGRDAHYGFGKYAVYPGGNYELHKVPFTDGAFRLEDGTGMASAVMPYYTIATASGGEAVGNGYSKEVVEHQLREQAGYDGVVCTDWVITADYAHPGIHGGKPWGVEGLSVADRHYKALMAGVDQFGGNNDVRPVMEAYERGVREHGREFMDGRMRKSAYRLLLNIFRTGLFENPYVDPAATKALVGCPDFMDRGYQAQLKSIVMLKNAGHALPLQGRPKVYVPSRTVPEHRSFWGATVGEAEINPVPDNVAGRYFERTDSAEEADAAIVFIDSPKGGWGYDREEAMEGRGNGYHPISLQYGDYTATAARAESLAGGDPAEESANRSYLGKSTTTVNRGDMELVRSTRQRIGNKPLIVVVKISNPPVLSEIEPYADAILFTFDVQNQAALDIITGRFEPSALLPFQVPASMEAVERHFEDTPRDIECHTDSEGNTYDFAFGLNWAGPIWDARTERYR